MSDHPFKLVSRPLVMAASGWLLVSWAINLAIDLPVSVTHDNMQPAVRWMVLCAVVGMGLIWPACRLTFTHTAHPAARAVSDALTLWLVFQVVVWPLRALVDWSTRQTVMIDAALAIWMIPLALWVGLGLGGGRIRRTVMMIFCVATLIGPALVPLVGLPHGHVGWSVFEMLWYLTQPTHFVEFNKLNAVLVAVAGVSTGLWIVGLAGRAMAGRPTEPVNSQPSGYDGCNDRDWSI